MTAASVLALCAARGVHLEAEGEAFRVRGPLEARAELKALVLEHRAEVLALLKRPALPGTTSGMTARLPLPPNGPGQAWSYNWQGVPVNLFGLRPGEDGRAPIFTAPKPEGLQ